MNEAAFAALPASACSLGAQGSFGPDRITRNVYDWAGQLTTVQKAYGTPLQQNYVGYEYTSNGRQKAVIDANGNRAEMRYDGLDRQSCWIFPSKTSAGALGGDCSTGDFESYAYDANGNRTTLRKRDGVSLGFQYDDLNRIKQKTSRPRSPALPATASSTATTCAGCRAMPALAPPPEPGSPTPTTASAGSSPRPPTWTESPAP